MYGNYSIKKETFIAFIRTNITATVVINVVTHIHILQTKYKLM